MKKIILASIFIFLGAVIRLSGQTTTITTYYVIQPTSGCNGVWAINDVQFALCNGGSYIYTPNNCAQGGVVSGDTLFLSLCSFPCDLYMQPQSGGACICGTGTILDVAQSSSAAITTTYPNPATVEGGWNIMLHQSQQSVSVSIFDETGQCVSAQQKISSSQIVPVDLSSFSPGIYFAEVKVNNQYPYWQKLIIIR